MMSRRLYMTTLWAWLTLVSAFGQTLRVTEMPQQPISVALGQYSGITWIFGNRYAVVDDKLPGGGIVFFDIPIRNDGKISESQVRMTVPEATLTSSVAGLDNEGVVFSHGKLYVSAESDQSIREYDLEGRATGTVFSIPADLGDKAIVKNGGFEAFTWNAATGQFWTTTDFR